MTGRFGRSAAKLPSLPVASGRAAARRSRRLSAGREITAFPAVVMASPPAQIATGAGTRA